MGISHTKEEERTFQEEDWLRAQTGSAEIPWCF